MCVWTKAFLALLYVVKSLALLPAAKVNGRDDIELDVPALEIASIVGLFLPPNETVLLTGFGALMGLGRGMACGGGIGSSADEGGEGGVEKARAPPRVTSFPPNEALLFFGFARGPALRALAVLVWELISEMGRILGCVFGLCLSFPIVTSGDAISSSSSWKSQTLDSTGAVEILPFFPFSSGWGLRLKCLLYVVILLRGAGPESFRVAIVFG